MVVKNIFFFKCHFGFDKYFKLNLNLNFVVGNIFLLFSTRPTVNYVCEILFCFTTISHDSIKT